MPRKLLLLVLAIFPLIAGTTCFGQEPSKKERPVPTFEDSVRIALEDSRNHYQATAQLFDSWRTRGYIKATVWTAWAAGAALLGGPGFALVAIPGIVDGLLEASEAGALRRVMQGQAPAKKKRPMLERDDY